jgi:hypothetical protein
MSDQGSDDDQRRDALLLRLLKMPPQTRAETAERARRAKGKPTRVRGKRASVAKRELSTLGEEEAGRRRDESTGRMIATQPQPWHAPIPKAKERPASKGRVHKGKTRD